MALVNIDRMYFAILTKDETGASGLQFETPEYIPGVRQIDAKAKTTTDKLYAEGKVWEQETSMEDIEIDIDLAELSNAKYAKYLGHHVAAEGGVYATDKDTAPYIGILVEATKANGKKTYRVYYKGKLNEPDDNAKTKEGKTDFQTHKATATFQPLKNNGMWKYQIDEDDPDCPADIAETFFASVIIPTAKTTTP